MPGLPRALIKKYGVSKKAWSIFRHQKKGSVKSMARHRKRKGHRVKAFWKKHKKGMGIMGVLIGGAAYGAGRQYVSNLISPLTSKIPAGQYADNVAMGLVSWALATGKIPLLNKVPMSREIGKAGLAIEAAFAGQELIGKGGGGSNGGVYCN